MERTITGLSLAASTILLVRWRFLLIFAILSWGGLLYDATHPPRPHRDLAELFLHSITLFACIISVFEAYWKFSSRVVFVVALAQLSDVLQYAVGKHFGKMKIGWPSPNKTWEGYVGGLAVLCLIWPVFWPNLARLLDVSSDYAYRDVLTTYGLSCLSSLLFSSGKRFLGWKDWSSLLGEHGGFLDRFDSIFLPLFYLV